jgi:four helix bundle protein
VGPDVSRDYRKLRVFALADKIIVETYRATRDFPADERYGLQSQIRRAAVSAATNIVEGSARESAREYAYFLNISLASATEADYLLGLAARLGYLSPERYPPLQNCYRDLLRQLRNLLTTVERFEPKA